ncbi:MAG: hypothetical protein LBU23_07910 [Planctomycetota bacterium]|jgi:hypothetical protein|nr:hypothetical protein [Planctomycetota bacterium]
MGETWRIPRRTRVCAQSGVALDLSKPFFSALLENNDSFERLDFSPGAWPEVDKGRFRSFWKNKGDAGDPDKPRAIDFDRLQAFFDSLEGAEEPDRRLFRYVLALILVRRRRLRLDDMSRAAEGDRLRLYDRRNGGRSLEVVSPEATREDLEKIQEKLNQLFDCDFEDMDW